MNKYYYGTSDKVWSSWSDSDLKAWLVERNIIKSNAQIQREKMMKLVSLVHAALSFNFGTLIILDSDHYTNAADTFWSAWSESDIRSWLINHGYLKSDAQARRDELVKMINDK
jgi:hypothetical protein